ncbi:MAG: hypothetical protein EXS52_02245 [Candidatus Staskawiczbacteria bacterium]|nr:hypothetical protein [Candidatus Staskawiczbacteria bacterium]
MIQSNGSFTINNVIVKEVYPANISNYGNLTLDGVAIGGDITQGINIGTVFPGQTKTITYQARVAQAQNFSFGTTTILDLVTISSTDSNFLPTTVSPVSILVSKSGVLGASTASTGLTNYFWVDSFFLPLALALLGIWLYRSKFIGVPSWVGSIQLKNKETSAQKELQNKIAMIRKEETK